jgi:hypothetical protein
MRYRARIGRALVRHKTWTRDGDEAADHGGKAALGVAVGRLWPAATFDRLAF